ncbi:MAG: enoyl-CoA hydratase [Acidimicrobiales bacterium]
MMPSLVLTEAADRIGTVTLNRPEARNALSSGLLDELAAAMAAFEADADVDVVVLTGADPAFCAGLDLKELGGAGADLAGRPRPWAPLTKPLIGAVNGVAITGGFELALQCDLLVASERARFADTHARVGVMPGWGLSVLLPQAVGVRKARELSLTGNFLTAEEAYEWGLVNHVVAHDELLAFTRRLAADMVGNDQAGVRQMLATYAATSATTVEDAWRREAEMGRQWFKARFDPALVEARRRGIMERGRGQAAT